MKRIATLALLAVLLSSCESAQKQWRHTQSAWVGLPRTITLFSANGDTLAHWSGSFMVEVDSGGVVSWIGADGMERKITGTIIVEQVSK